VGSLRRSLQVGTCLVVADPDCDGREALVRVIESLVQNGTEITDASIALALNAPALTDPDLVVVLGSGHELPPSLVWELAYSELAFVDVSWADLQAAHLGDAIATYSHRHRRFGGLD
jgi:undecaprenyl diphosphate synthase